MKTYDFTQPFEELQQIIDRVPTLPTTEEVEELIGPKLDQSILINYAELKQLRDSASLVPGQFYRIIDYVTTVTDSIDFNAKEVLVRSAEHQFDVIVFATTSSTLASTAFAARHEGDTYFENTDFSKWHLKYSLDPDTYSWADTVNGKGVIYEMTDEFNNTLPFDFKNIQYKRYTITGVVVKRTDFNQGDQGWLFYQGISQLLSDTTTSRIMSKLGLFMHPFVGYWSEQRFYDSGVINKWGGAYVMQNGGTRMFAVLTADYDIGAAIAECDTSMYCWCYTFSQRTSLSVTEATDYSLTGRCFDNTFYPYRSSSSRIEYFLLENVFLFKKNDDMYGNHFLSNFVHNTVSSRIRVADVAGSVQGCSFSGSYLLSIGASSVRRCTFSGDVSLGGSVGSLQNSVFSGSVSLSGKYGIYESWFKSSVESTQIGTYCSTSIIEGSLSNSMIHYLYKVTLTTDSAGAKTINNVNILGEISNTTITVPNNSNSVVNVGLNSQNNIVVWKPADLVTL